MLSPAQVQAARASVGIDTKSSQVQQPQKLSGADLANHYLTLGGKSNSTPLSTDSDTNSAAGEFLDNSVKGVKKWGSDVNTATENEAKTAVSNLKGDFNKGMEGLSKIGDPNKSIGEQASGAVQSFFRGGVGTIADLAKLIFSPVTGMTQGSVKQMSDLAGATVLNPDNPTMQKIATSAAADKVSAGVKGLEDWAKEHPDMAKGITDSITVAMMAAGGKGVSSEMAANAEGGGLKQMINPSEIESNLDNSGFKMNPNEITTNFGEKKIATPKADTSVMNDATPAYDKKLIGEPAIKNPDGTFTPRISEVKEGIKGALDSRKVNPTAKESLANKELEKLPEYPKNGTYLEKANYIQSQIVKEGESLETALKNEKIVRPPKEVAKIIRTVVNDASENSLLLQKTDPIVKNYMRVANRAIEQNDGSLSGELGIRKALDRAYEDAGGKYANNKGLDQIHRAARNALNDDLEAHAKSTSVKASLKKQSNLYNAYDVLSDKAAAEGGSKIEQVINNHPLIKAIPHSEKIIKAGQGISKYKK